MNRLLLAFFILCSSMCNPKSVAQVERTFNAIPLTRIDHSTVLELPAAQGHINISASAQGALKKMFVKKQSQEFARKVARAPETPAVKDAQTVLRKLLAIFEAKVSTNVLLIFPNEKDNVHFSCYFTINNETGAEIKNPKESLDIEIKTTQSTAPEYLVNLLQAVSTQDGFFFTNRKRLFGLTTAGLLALGMRGPAIMRKRGPRYPETSFTQAAFDRFVTDFSNELASQNKLAEYNVHTDKLTLEKTHSMLPALQNKYDSTWQRIAPLPEIPTNTPLVVISAPYKGSITALATQQRLCGNTNKKQLRIIVTLLSTFSAKEVHKYHKVLTENNWRIVTINDLTKTYSYESNISHKDIHAIFNNGEAYSYFESPLPVWYFVATNPVTHQETPVNHVVYRVTGANMHRRNETRYYGNSRETTTYYKPDYACTSRWADTTQNQPWLAAITIIKDEFLTFPKPFFTVLEVPENASGADVEAAYQRLKKRSLSDKSKTKLEHAYFVLRADTLRDAYKTQSPEEFEKTNATYRTEERRRREIAENAAACENFLAGNNPYAILGVDQTAENSAVKKAYNKLAREKHPDKGGDVEQFKLLEPAYNLLLDPIKRAALDAFLLARTAVAYESYTSLIKQLDTPSHRPEDGEAVYLTADQKIEMLRQLLQTYCDNGLITLAQKNELLRRASGSVISDFEAFKINLNKAIQDDDTPVPAVSWIVTDNPKNTISTLLRQPLDEKIHLCITLASSILHQEPLVFPGLDTGRLQTRQYRLIIINDLDGELTINDFPGENIGIFNNILLFRAAPILEGKVPEVPICILQKTQFTNMTISFTPPQNILWSLARIICKYVAGTYFEDETPQGGGAPGGTPPASAALPQSPSGTSTRRTPTASVASHKPSFHEMLEAAIRNDPTKVSLRFITGPDLQACIQKKLGQSCSAPETNSLVFITFASSLLENSFSLTDEELTQIPKDLWKVVIINDTKEPLKASPVENICRKIESAFNNILVICTPFEDRATNSLDFAPFDLSIGPKSKLLTWSQDNQASMFTILGHFIKLFALHSFKEQIKTFNSKMDVMD